MTDQPTETEEPVEDLAQTADTPDDTAEEAEAVAEAGEEEAETFPREYVQKLRDEAAKYRQRAGDRDTLAERLHTALVAATGRLADPTDLTFDEDHLTDDDALSAALDELLTRKPHLASRRVVGDVGQGATQGDTAVDLAGILRSRAS